MSTGFEVTVPSAVGDEDAATDLGRYRVLGRLGAGGMGIVLAAHDPALDRRVAIKVLWPSLEATTRDGTARLEREAQAMAKLAHPNVITVFEVDRVGDRVYVAMELVEGSSLREWMAQPARSWREIVTMFVTAGRGLAAAHAAGLVHRDFKPDNVLIGRDDRPRVSDFGLVAETPREASASNEPVEPGVDMTVRGSAVGTPAYMSPEQWAGQLIDARSDQFAFCISLWEALWGRRPFPGTTASELRAAVGAGAIVVPAGPRPAPRRVLDAVWRGLAVSPAARWPALDDLLDELERCTRARRRKTVAAFAGATAIAAMVAGLLIAGRRDADEPCAPPDARMAQIWSPVRGALLRARFGAIDPIDGPARSARIVAALDNDARAFRAMHVEACRATRVDGRQSDTLLDRRMECLDHWLGELGATVAFVEQAGDRAAVGQAVSVASGVSSLGVCADVHRLSDALAPPPEPAQRAASQALIRRALELQVALRGGKLDGLLDQARAVVAAAKSLGHPPTISWALNVEVRIQFAVGDDGGSEATLLELARVAGRCHDNRDVAFALLNLFRLYGVEQGKREQALALLPSVDAAILLAGDPGDLRVELLYDQAAMFDYSGRPADGLALLIQARHIVERGDAPSVETAASVRLPDILLETGIAQSILGQLDPAIATFQEAIQGWRAVYGPDSPDEAFGWQNLGETFRLLDHKADALAAFRTAARIREAKIGESHMLVTSLVGIGMVLDDLGSFDDALAILDRALAIDRAQLAAGDPGITGVLVARGILLRHLGRLDDALHAFDEVIAVADKSGATTLDLPTALDQRGEIAARRGHCDKALLDLTRSLSVLEPQVQPTAHELLSPLVGKAGCLLRLGRPADAIGLLDRALGLKAQPSDAESVARATDYLGRAWVESGRDVAGGLAKVRAARTELHDPALVRDLDDWLSRRGAR